MRVQVVGQPFGDDANLFDFIEAGVADVGLRTLCIAVAWAKRSGFARISSQLDEFRARGGVVSAVVGISEGGATVQGLEYALRTCDAAYVFHESGRTFHPKCYLFGGDCHAEIFVGSNNLTAGGVYWNYELGVWLSLNLAESRDFEVYERFCSWFSGLLNDDQVCLPLTDDLLVRLTASRRYQIQDETERSDFDGVSEVGDSLPGLPADEPLFGRSARPKKRDPIDRVRARRRSAPTSQGKQAVGEGEVPDLRQGFNVMKRWFKLLKGSDAQQPPSPNSSPTGNLRLAKAGHPIDHTYFRSVFFGDAAWVGESVRGGLMEQAHIRFEVAIGDRIFALQQMRVSHAPHRVSGQNNIPTTLHWNSEVGEFLRKHSVVGRYVVLEKSDDSRYRLTISAEPPGPFLDSDVL